MTNHDTALVIGIWAIALIVFGLVLLHDRWNASAELVDDMVEPDEEPQEPRYRPFTRDELSALFHNPATPPVIRVMAAAQLHKNGWCSCGTHPYDQAAQLTSDDIDWLTSQRGDAS